MNRLCTFAAALLLALPSALLAQDGGDPQRLLRADVSGTAAWVNVNKTEFSDYDNWRGQGGFGIGGGWYWTNHLHTRVETSVTSKATIFATSPVVLSTGQPQYFSRIRRFHSQRVSVVQHYQFRRNEWVHPFVGAGVEVVREHWSGEDAPVFVYDPVTRLSRPVRDGVQYPERAEVTTRAVLTTGVKAYLSRTVFALSDLRVGVGGRRTEDVQLRIGLGVDFR
jgi:opacity protein-like surface antigen